METDSFDMAEASNEVAAGLFPQSSIEAPEEVPEIEPKEDLKEEPIEEVIEEPKEKPEEETQIRTAPQSWKKEMHEAWSTLTPDIQDYIELREQQMREGIDVAKEDATMGRSIRDLVTPYQELLKQQNVKDVDAIKYLLNAHYNLSTASEEDRAKLFNQMAESYGVKLDRSNTPPETQALLNRIQQLEKIVNQSQQNFQQEKEAKAQEEEAKAQEEVNAFVSEHEFFDDVAEDIVLFIKAGCTLEEAYEKAIWANPIIREKEIERLEKEKLESLEKEKQEQAKKAEKAKSVNVKSKDTGKAPTGSKGKMFDDLEDKYEKIQNR